MRVTKGVGPIVVIACLVGVTPSATLPGTAGGRSALTSRERHEASWTAAGAQPESREKRVEQFYDRARTIIEKNQNLEWELDEARRRVNGLYKDLKSWSQTNNEPLTPRAKTYNYNSTEHSEPASTELCPLFFAEELDELCPLDETRSEVWGARMVFCRYECLT